MTETILKIRLAELKTVRILCGRESCGGVIELPASDLAKLPSGVRCPVCSQAFSGEAGSSIFTDLGAVLDRLSRHHFTLEFPVSMDGA